MSTASTVYVYSNMLEKPCIDAAPMLDKTSRCLQNRLSTHPVLWICSRFSTVEPDFGRFDVLHVPFLPPGEAFGGLQRLAVPLTGVLPCLQLRSADVDANVASCSSCRQNDMYAVLTYACGQEASKSRSAWRVFSQTWFWPRADACFFSADK